MKSGNAKSYNLSTTYYEPPEQIYGQQPPPNDMRPRLVDRAKVKAARAASRRNRRKR